MGNSPSPPKKKLIEVELPLDAIIAASARETSIRHGHPSTLHMWWARRPLSACRAVLFAQLVDDPSSYPDQFPTPDAQQEERQRLFRLIEELVRWENSGNEEVMARARAEIWKSCDGMPPPVLDPFCGGGSIALEAQRLGLEVHASDINPVAVLITRALIEIPPKLAGMPPLHLQTMGSHDLERAWEGAQGLAQDVLHYGERVKASAESRLAHLYPNVLLPEPGPEGLEAEVIAWIWTRTVQCPNPACGARAPLARTFSLATKEDQVIWAEPVVDFPSKRVRFLIKEGDGPPPEGTVDRKGARCIVCDSSISFDWIRMQGEADAMSAQMIAVVADAKGKRLYLAPDAEQERAAAQAVLGSNAEEIDVELPPTVAARQRGLRTYRSLFTARQLVLLDTLVELVHKVHEEALQDAQAATPLARAQADAITTYLAIVVDKLLPEHCALTTWSESREQVTPALPRPTLPMSWTYAEANPLRNGSSVERAIQSIVAVLERLPVGSAPGLVRLASATSELAPPITVISTDPPYFDVVDSTGLSDFFYVWLRRMLSHVHPDLFPANRIERREVVVSATADRGRRAPMEASLEEAMRSLPALLRNLQRPGFPLVFFWHLPSRNDGAAQGTAAIGEAPSVASSFAESDFDRLLRQMEAAGLSPTAAWPLDAAASRTVEMGSRATRPQAETALYAGRVPAVLAWRPTTEILAEELGPRPRLLSVQVQNFKSIEQCYVALGPLMFLVGPNGAGKSNFLDALRFIADAIYTGTFRKREGTEELLHRGASGVDAFVISLGLLLSSGTRASYMVEIQIHDGTYRVLQELCRVESTSALSLINAVELWVQDGVVTSPLGLGIKLPPASTDRLYLPSVAGLPAFRPVYEALSSMAVYNPHPERIRSPQPPGPADRLAPDGSNLAGVLARLPKESRQRVERYLAAVVPGIEAVERKALGPVETLEFLQRVSEEGELTRLYAANMSDGTLRALAVLVALFQASDAAGAHMALVGIEEPEIAIHPGAVGALRDALRETSRHTQVLVTSHSPDLLDDKEIAPEELLSVVFEKGATKIGPIDEVSKSALRDRLYTAGELLRANQLEPER